MSSKRKAPTREATPAEATETAAYGRAAVPGIHSTTAAAGRQFKIVDLLSYGSENGVTLHHLEKMIGAPGREIRREIERERRAGALIVSDNRHGYYLADSPAEAQRFARSMRRRAAEISRTARAIEEAAVVD